MAVVKKRLPTAKDIKKHMDDNGIMQKWLCDKTGISATHVYNFINGHRGISDEKLKKIASALKLS